MSPTPHLKKNLIILKGIKHSKIDFKFLDTSFFLIHYSKRLKSITTMVDLLVTMDEDKEEVGE